MLAALLNLGFAGGGVYVPPEPTAETFTGGFLAWKQFRDEREVRQRRIAMGILPPDEPEREAIIEAATQPTPTLAKRYLRQIAEGEARLAELDALLEDVLIAQRIAEEQAYQALLEELRLTQAEAATFVRNQNAMATLVMLGLL